jgi:hypothetical protein
MMLYLLISQHSKQVEQLHSITELCGIGDVGQMETHTAEPLVPDPGPFDVDIAITKLKQYKSPGSVQIPLELIQAEGETIVFAVHKLIHFT